MIGGKSVLGIIPARGGSKSIPGKNIVELAGKPLIGWTIDAAKETDTIDRLILSTDSTAIADKARDLGCEVPFMRPPELAADDTPGMDVVFHALDNISGFELVVLLQPTSPFRTAEDIDEAIRLLAETNAPAVVSVTPALKPPEWLYYRDNAGQLSPVLLTAEPVTRRQDSKPVFFLNGAIYVAQVDWLREQGSFMGEGTLAFEMPAERSLDIDVPLDLQIATSLLQV